MWEPSSITIFSLIVFLIFALIIALLLSIKIKKTKQKKSDAFMEDMFKSIPNTTAKDAVSPHKVQSELNNHEQSASEILQQIINRIRFAGFAVSLDQMIAAYNLVLTRTLKNQLPHTLSAYKYILAPIFCGSETEQQRFYRLVEDWIAMDRVPFKGRELEPEEKESAVKFYTHEIESGVQYKRKITKPYKIAALLLLSGLIAAGIYTGFKFKVFHLPGVPEQVPPEITIETPTPTPIPTPTPESPVPPDGPINILNGETSKLPMQPPVPIEPDSPRKIGQGPSQPPQSNLSPIVLSGIVIVAFWLIVWWIWRWRNQLWLHRGGDEASLEISKFHVRKSEGGLFDSETFHNAANLLRRHRQVASNKLDIKRSVDASIRHGGYFYPEYASRPVSPEYLVLVSQVHHRDHMRSLVDTWLGRMRKEGLYGSPWYFFKDPRSCHQDEGDSRYSSLSELGARCQDHRLILVGDCDGLFDPLSGEPQQWIQEFNAWKLKAYISPKSPEHWGYQEHTLHQRGFAVVPLSEAGVSGLGEYFYLADKESVDIEPPFIKPSIDTTPYPPLLQLDEERWLRESSPPKPIVDHLYSELREYLGQRMLELMSACAVYPKLSWNLTIYLDSVIPKAKAAHEDRNRDLLTLVRLPWFRFSWIPDFLREKLVKELPKQRKNTISLALRNLLLTALARSENTFDLDIIRQPSKTVFQQFKSLLKKEPPSSPLRDQIFLTSMRGLHYRTLSFKLPRVFERVISEDRAPSSAVETAKKPKPKPQVRLWKFRGANAVTAVAAVVVTFFVLFVWVGSYTANIVHIDVVSEHVSRYNKLIREAGKDPEIASVLPAINELNAARNVYKDSGLTWLSGLGLSKRETIESEADAAYHRALVREFLPRIALRLEQQLRTETRDPEILHSALKAYLMLYDLKHLDPEYLKLWMELDWEKSFTGDAVRQNLLSAHLSALLEYQFGPIKVNPTLVANSRRILQKMPFAQRIYSRLKQDAAINIEYAINLQSVLGTRGQSVLAFKQEKKSLINIPSLYTFKGFHQVYLKEGMQFAVETTEETWVLGDIQTSTVDLDRLYQQVSDLYIKDYIRTWNDALANIQLARIKDLNHAIDSLEILSGPQSPLSALLSVVDKNTALTRLPGLTAMEAGTKANQLSSVARRVLSAMSRAQDTGASKPAKDGPGSVIEKAFRHIHELVQGGENTPSQLNRILNQISEVYTFVASIKGGSTGSAALRVAAQRMTGGHLDAIGKLRSLATRQQNPVKDWLLDAADYSWLVILTQAHAHLNAIWQSNILPRFDGGLKNRYPLRKTSSDEIALTDFSNFFGPGGELEVFFNNYLKPFVIVKRGGWQLRSFESRTIGLSRISLSTFENASVIRNVLFPGGAITPTVRFSLKPLYLDPSINRFQLDIDGQNLVYRHGPPRSAKLQWPGPEGPTRVRISFEAASGHISRTKEGPWGLFRLLDESEVIKSRSNGRYKVTFEIAGRKAQYEMQADSVVNPFRLSALERFDCPKRL